MKPPASGPMTLERPKTAPNVTHVAAPLTRAHEVADDRLGADHQPACADTL